MSSVGLELPKEIERVSAKRERYRGYAREFDAEASFSLAIGLMTHDIDAAHSAIASGDPIAALRAYEALKGYSDDD